MPTYIYTLQLEVDVPEKGDEDVEVELIAGHADYVKNRLHELGGHLDIQITDIDFNPDSVQRI
jgi:hypothetical protein